MDLRTHQWFRLQLVESNNCQMSKTSFFFWHLSISASVATLPGIYSGTDYVVTFCKGVHNCHVPYQALALVLGVQG